MRTGIAHLPLHGGKAPTWLFMSIDILHKALDKSKIDYTEKIKAFHRLADFQKKEWGLTLNRGGCHARCV